VFISGYRSGRKYHKSYYLIMKPSRGKGTASTLPVMLVCSPIQWAQELDLQEVRHLKLVARMGILQYALNNAGYDVPMKRRIG
jgi:hypothetical protein